MDSLASMSFPGFEPGNFDVAAGFPNHFTAWSARGKRTYFATEEEKFLVPKSGLEFLFIYVVLRSYFV